ncbi:Leucine-rich repeat (LRR) family protein [Tripterygium wilfordii]|uniref:Leucine-rich repeat (LRR) family protein n=1 Tax=Tripterygium wilfordii TaxID=458696 RepID=A0A7J7DU67_TRIWF|nr:Leucine-rich repeat (LRR) family protein [Tripterygium wilfordii]
MQILKWVFKLFFIYSSFNVFSGMQAQRSPIVCSEADRASLLGFKAKIVMDTTEILSSWVGTDCCGGDWEGVECNPTGRVTGLKLQRPDRGAATGSGMYMKGTLSPSLGALQFLEMLVISGMKHIAGPIPDSLSNLTHLTTLVLEDNSLEGNIPLGLGHLSSLKALSLSGNQLRGQIDPSLGNFRNLNLLNLARNSFSGPIPSTFISFISLQSLDLSFNLFTGYIPDFVGQFQNLTYLDLSNNLLSGQVPISMFSLASLSDLSLSHNQLTGTIPDQIVGLKSLTSLQFCENRFIGQIPESISRLQNLWNLNLSRNGFIDPLPVIPVRGLPSLLSIDLSHNNLSLGPSFSVVNRPVRDRFLELFRPI